MTQDPFRQSVEGFDGTYPPFWDPKPNELLIGQLVRYEQGTTRFGPAWIAVVMNEDTGDYVSVWLVGHVLLGEFVKLKPREGERVGIKFMGKKQPEHAGGSEYNHYFVQVDRKGRASPFESPTTPAPAEGNGGRAPQQAAPTRRDIQGGALAPGAPTRDDTDNLRSDWVRTCTQYRVEKWQLDAIAQAAPQLRDDLRLWTAEDYRAAIALFKRHGAPMFNSAAVKLAGTYPASPDDLLELEKLLEEGNIPPKEKLRIGEARDTGWNDAVMWALAEARTIQAGGSDVRAPASIAESLPRSLSEPDDDLPF